MRIYTAVQQRSRVEPHGARQPSEKVGRVGVREPLATIRAVGIRRPNVGGGWQHCTAPRVGLDGCCQSNQPQSGAPVEKYCEHAPHPKLRTKYEVVNSRKS